MTPAKHYLLFWPFHLKFLLGLLPRQFRLHLQALREETVLPLAALYFIEKKSDRIYVAGNLPINNKLEYANKLRKKSLFLTSSEPFRIG